MILWVFLLLKYLSFLLIGQLWQSKGYFYSKTTVAPTKYVTNKVEHKKDDLALTSMRLIVIYGNGNK